MNFSEGAFAGPAHGAVAGAVFALLLTAACVSDLRTRRIPNQLVLVLLALGTLYSISAAPVLPGLGRALGGLAVGLALWFPFYLFGMLGAGDVKFFAAASSWLGITGALHAAFYSAVAGGALALLWPALQGGLRTAAERVALQVAHRQGLALSERDAKLAKLPYGIAMALGLALAAWLPRLLAAS
jgi:prepilin peptidase CpaA